MRKLNYKDKASYDSTLRCSMFIISHTLHNLIVPDKIKIDMQDFAAVFVSSMTNTFDLWVLWKFAQFFAPSCKSYIYYVILVDIVLYELLCVYDVANSI